VPRSPAQQFCRGRKQAQAAPDKIRIGYAITMSGPLGPGAEANTISQYKLWQKVVNDAGGIALKKYGRKVAIELVTYDDRGQPDELLKLLERLILQDKVDLVLSPYATHMNLAAAPIINKYQYPTIMTTAGAERIIQLAPNWPYAFWSLAQPKDAATPLATMCAGLKKEGKIKGRVAAIHVAQDAGVELHSAFTEAAKKEGLEIVFSKSYPFGASDLQPLIREVMGDESGCPHGVQLSAGYVHADGTVENPGIQSPDLLRRHRLGVSRLQGQVRKRCERDPGL
jgi:branched-chain amino acid transport system substrate-binding protein